MAESSTRTLRSRRIVALLAWGALVFTAIWLSNARHRGEMTVETFPPVAFILSAFSAFIGVFAWMLFNPARRSAMESPTLFFAAGATIFPSPVIGFCLLAADSPLRLWLALGLFLLCVIAILSHVPDEFFGVPRNRYSYLIPIPAFDGVEDEAMDPHADWFRVTDLAAVVTDTERPSLAPRSYLQRETGRPQSREAEVQPPSDVDDILGSEFDVGLLDDPVWDVEQRTHDDAGSDVDHGLLPSEKTSGSDESRAEPIEAHKDAATNREPDRVDSGQNRLPIMDDEQQYESKSNVSGPGVSAAVPFVRRPTSDIQEDRSQDSADDSDDADASPLLPRRVLHQPDSLRSRDSEPVEHDYTDSRTSGDEAETLHREFPRQRPSHDVSDPAPTAERRSESVTRTSDPRRTSEATESPAETDRRSGQTKRSVDHRPLQLERTTDESGSEMVEGVLTVRFEEGQKRANLHVPFSPPLAGIPEVECECVGDEQLRLKVPVRQSWGIRIEARRSRADSALETEIGFAALCSPDS